MQSSNQAIKQSSNQGMNHQSSKRGIKQSSNVAPRVNLSLHVEVTSIVLRS